MPDPMRFRVAQPRDLHRLTFDPARDPALTASIVALLGSSLPAPHRPSGTNPMLLWQGPHDILIAGLGAREAALREVIAGRSALLGNAGDGLLVFNLSGGLFERIGHDRPGPGPASRVMRLAGLRVTMLWPGDDPDRASIHVDRSHGAYLADWLVDRWRAQSQEGTA
jgi:hypothetical protein